MWPRGGSATGASSEICRRASAEGWSLIITPYVITEIEANLLPAAARTAWELLRTQFKVMDDVFTLDRPAIFGPAKDRPILFSALAWADVLLTLDTADFGAMTGQRFYGLRVVRPGTFLEEERAAGRLGD